MVPYVSISEFVIPEIEIFSPIKTSVFGRTVDFFKIDISAAVSTIKSSSLLVLYVFILIFNSVDGFVSVTIFLLNIYCPS
jgi:hypothetical protein